MSEDALEERLAAVERALDGATAEASGEETDVAARIDDVETRVDQLEAAVQAVRGYVGNVKHVNDEVQQRADAAMAKAEAVERALDGDRPLDAPVAPGSSRRDERQDADPGPVREERSERCQTCGRAPNADDHAGRPGDHQPPGSEPDEPAERTEPSRGRSRLPGDGRSGVGHAELAPRDDPEPGLLARLREVL